MNSKTPATKRSHRRLQNFVGSALCAMLCSVPSLRANDNLKPGQYAVDVRIAMPNLEENLRYANSEHRLCVSTAVDLFPILQQPSLRACTLVQVGFANGRGTYDLRCAGGNGISGLATLTSRGTRIRGVLQVKTGAKNMTFSQRIDASYSGHCN